MHAPPPPPPPGDFLDEALYSVTSYFLSVPHTDALLQLE